MRRILRLDDASKDNLKRLEAFGDKLFEDNQERLQPFIRDLKAHAQQISPLVG